MAAYGAARLAYLGYNNLKHENVLKPPSVKKIIEKDNNISALLQERFAQWKNYYVK